MRRFPLPRAAVVLAVSTGSPHPVLAAGQATEDDILDLRRLISEEGPSASTGGQMAKRWVAKMAAQLDPEFCPDGDCDDIGLYGVVDTHDHNVVYSVLRSSDFENFEKWTDKGWVRDDLPDGIDLRVLTEESAEHVIESLREGCDGSYLHPGDPVAFLPRDEEVIIAEPVVAAASGEKSSSWDESKHPRDKGKFAKKDSSEKSDQQKTKARAADMARYIKEGGKRPVGVKAAEKKGKGGGGGGGKAKGGGKGKGKGKGGGKGKSAGSLKKEGISKQESAEREEKAAADLEAEQAKQARAAKLEADKKAIADEHAKRIKGGESVASAEKWAKKATDEAVAKAKAVEEDVAAKEKVRKLEYQKRMARLAAQKKGITAAVAIQDEEGGDDWVVYAVVDDLDPNAVMDLVRMRAGDEGLELQVWVDGDWADDDKLLAQLRGVDPPPLVELTEEQIEMLLEQMSTEKPKAATAAVSPDPRAAKLRAYWVSGKGRLKIKWGAPGDFKRCVKHLRKYIPARTEGYCANLHKMATGMWPGDRRNRGVAGSGASEDVLWDAVMLGGWILDQPVEVDMLNDGIYSEAEDDLMGAVVAGASFPVAPPDEWFQDPGLKGPTPMTVDEHGHVYGHIATFDVPHIGMPGKVHAPRSKSGYAFFKTGQLLTASGAKINVGQLTLAGGHAPLSADAAAAVAHYDNTNSAVADLNIGEDRYGIWVAGAVRPETSPDQLRALRAAAPSGDWRPINGSLELVAVCQVNVPGFPVARARVASGAVVALVAAGARPLAVQRASMLADAAVLDRLGNLESVLLGPVDTDDDEDEDEAPEEKPESPEPEVSEKVQRAREYVRAQRMERLRQRVYGRRETPAADAEEGD